MSFFTDKISKLVLGPIAHIADTINEWGKEPLKKWEHERNESAKDKDVDRQINLANARIREESKIRREESILENELLIKRETEINKINKEAEEWQKDQQFERMKKVSEAIMHYQTQLTQLNLKSIEAIGSMELSLRDKAQELILDKTYKYNEIQDKAIVQAEMQLLSIEEKFASNERMKDILISAVDAKLASIIQAASNFLIELEGDIKALNHNISSLTQNGQKFIQSHLENFQIANNGDITKHIETKSDKF